MEGSYQLAVTSKVLLKLNTYQPFKETLAVGTDFARVILNYTKETIMGKIRTLIMIIISTLMVLTTSGMAGADTIGFTWTDTTSEPWGSDVTYSVSIDTVTGNGTLTVYGWDTDWTLNWVAFQLGGVKFDGSNSFYKVDFDDTNIGTISINFNVYPVTGKIPTDPANQVWSLQAEYSDGPAGNSGKLVTNRLSVTVPEPTTICLLGLGLIGLWGFRKKLKK
jgi:hypothetical protein